MTQSIKIRWTIEVDVSYFIFDLNLHFGVDISVGESAHQPGYFPHIQIIKQWMIISKQTTLINNIIMMMSGDERYQFKSKVIKKDNDTKVFAARINQLRQIQSYHMYPIASAKLSNIHSEVTYQANNYNQTIADLINNKLELLPTEIKSFIWQITKLMLQCQTHQINHLRLQPKSIVLMQKYKQGQPFFVQVKDFSLGKQFEQVSEGKLLDFFQFMHPALSVQNNMINFDTYKPEYDIWSLGVILYYLVYNVSPFCKPNKDKYSKTILRKFRAKEHQIPYQNNKYGSINLFISKCLNLIGKDNFSNWGDIKKWIIINEQLYNEIDFQYKRFQDMAEQHIRLMTLLSAIYCMIIHQCNNSPHSFWRVPASFEQQVPFQIQIAQFTLRLMRVMHEKFQRIYGGHFFLLPKPMRQVLDLIKNKIKVEEQHKGNYWLQPRFKEAKLNLSTIKIIQQICAKLKIELSDVHPQLNSSSRLQRRNTLTERKIWKSMQIIYDYCNEIICIFNQFKNRMKLIYEYFYTSKILRKISEQGFNYQSILIV